MNNQVRQSDSFPTILGAEEIKLLIREFNPSKYRDLYAQQWIKDVEALGTIYNWDPYHHLLYASMRLTGIAKMWYEYSLESIGNWNDFKRELMKNFPRKHNAVDINAKLLARKRRSDEVLEEYVHSTVMLGKTIKLADDAIVEHLIRGLDQSKHKTVLASLKVSTPKEFLQHMQRLEDEDRKQAASLRLQTPSSDRTTTDRRISPHRSPERQTKKPPTVQDSLELKKIDIEQGLNEPPNIFLQEAPSSSDGNWLKAVQTDEKIQHLRKILTDELNVPDAKYIKSRYKLKYDSVHFETNHGSRYYLPKGLITEAFLYSHFSTGHTELDTTLLHLQKAYWLQQLREEMWKRVRVCAPCVVQKLKPDEDILLPQCHLRGNIPFYMMYIAFYGPFPKTRSTKQYVFVAIDSYSKFVVMQPTADAREQAAIEVLEDVIKYIATPSLLVCLNTEQFRSSSFREFCTENGIKRALVPIFQQSCESFEKHWKHVQEALYPLREGDCRSVEETVQELQKNLNRSENSEEILLKYSPINTLAESLYRRLTKGFPKSSDEEITHEAVEKMETLQEEGDAEDQFDHDRTYSEGDLVLVCHSIPPFTTSREIRSNYRGPYVVRKVLGGGRYVVSDTPMSQITVKRFIKICSTNSIKRWMQKEI